MLYKLSGVSFLALAITTSLSFSMENDPNQQESPITQIPVDTHHGLAKKLGRYGLGAMATTSKQIQTAYSAHLAEEKIATEGREESRSLLLL